MATHRVFEFAAQSRTALGRVKPNNTERQLKNIGKNSLGTWETVFGSVYRIKNRIGTVLLIDGECRISVLHLISGSMISEQCIPKR